MPSVLLLRSRKMILSKPAALLRAEPGHEQRCSLFPHHLPFFVGDQGRLLRELRGSSLGVQVRFTRAHYHQLGSDITNTHGGVLESGGACERLVSLPMIPALTSIGFGNFLSVVGRATE